MHEAAFAKAALPEPVTVLKLPLRPYSLGHQLWLMRLGSPFLSSGTPTQSDLLQAVLICSQSMDQIEASRRDRWMGYKSRLILYLARRDRSFNQEREMTAFYHYLIAGMTCAPTCPERAAGSSPSRSPGAPLVLRLVNFLMRTMHKTEAEAWDYPLALAQWHWAAHWESEGALRIKNLEDLRMDTFREFVAGKPVNLETLAEAKKRMEEVCPV